MAVLVRREHIDSVIRVVSTLREVESLRFTVSQVTKGSMMIAGCAFLGGLLGGKTGLTLGGGLGALAVGMGQSNYKSAVDIICNDLTQVQKQDLYGQLQQLCSGIDSSDLNIVQGLLTSPSVKAAVATTVLSYLTEQGYNMLTAA